jgi:hypothetical protein
MYITTSPLASHPTGTAKMANDPLHAPQHFTQGALKSSAKLKH